VETIMRPIHPIRISLLVAGLLVAGCPSGSDAPAEPSAPAAAETAASAAGDAPAAAEPAAEAAAAEPAAEAAAAEPAAEAPAAEAPPATPPPAAGGGAQYANFTLGAGFLPDPQTGTGTTGGPVDASTYGPGCVGSIDTTPDHTITVTSTVNLKLFVDSDVDSTLVVRGPAGTFCDDDSHGNLDPELNVTLTPGEYHVWVGNFGSTQGTYTLTLTENMGAPAGGTPGDTCANPLPLPLVGGTGHTAGVLDGFTNTIGDRIEVTGYSWSGSDVFYAVEAPANTQFTVTLDDKGSFDGGIYVIADCANPVGSVFAGLDTTPTRPLTFSNGDNTRFIVVVDAWQGRTSGNYELTVASAGAAPAGVTCEVGAQIQVFWGSSWYDATVKQTREDGQCYIGYDGWADSWDEWVGADRMRARQ
jgi:hypothetical protein